MLVPHFYKYGPDLLSFLPDVFGPVIDHNRRPEYGDFSTFKHSPCILRSRIPIQFSTIWLGHRLPIACTQTQPGILEFGKKKWLSNFCPVYIVSPCNNKDQQNATYFVQQRRLFRTTNSGDWVRTCEITDLLYRSLRLPQGSEAPQKCREFQTKCCCPAALPHVDYCFWASSHMVNLHQETSASRKWDNAFMMAQSISLIKCTS